jgi:hypothetical protein
VHVNGQDITGNVREHMNQRGSVGGKWGGDRGGPAHVAGRKVRGNKDVIDGEEF